MRSIAILLAGAVTIVAVGMAVSAAQPDPAKTLRSVQAFASIADDQQRSLALFEEAGKVITHARCVNCHPAGDRPAQGDDRRPHMPLVVRGVDNFGAVGMRCTTCHGPANFDAAGIPGNPAWHVAPIEMAWVGKSLGEICRQIKDPQRNGGKVDGGADPPHGGRLARRLGMEARRRSRTGSRNAEGIWRTDQGVVGYGSSLPGHLKPAALGEVLP